LLRLEQALYVSCTSAKQQVRAVLAEAPCLCWRHAAALRGQQATGQQVHSAHHTSVLRIVQRYADAQGCQPLACKRKAPAAVAEMAAVAQLACCAGDTVLHPCSLLLMSMQQH